MAKSLHPQSASPRSRQRDPRRNAVPPTWALLLALLCTLPFGCRAASGSDLDRARASFSEEVGPLGLGALQPPAIEGPDNAGRWLLAGTEAIVLREDEKTVLKRLGSQPAAAWSPEDRQSLDGILERSAPALELLGRMDGSIGSTLDLAYENGVDMALPNFIDVLDGQRLVFLAARRDLTAGDARTAAGRLPILRAAARSLETEAVLIAQLVGLAVERLELELEKDLLESELVGEDSLARMARGLEHRLAIDSMLRRSIRGEASVLDAADLERLSEAVSGGENAPAIPTSKAERRRVIATVLDTYRGVAASLGEPYARLHARGGAPVAPRDHAASRLAVNWNSVIARAQAVAASRQLLDLGRDLRRAGLATGAYELPSEIASDPFTGEPIQVLRASDGGLELHLDGADAVWRLAFPDTDRRPPPFSLRLPALRDVRPGLGTP